MSMNTVAMTAVAMTAVARNTLVMKAAARGGPRPAGRVAKGSVRFQTVGE
jgi:hypothetical protein